MFMIWIWIHFFLVRIRIRIKIKWILSTAYNCRLYFVRLILIRKLYKGILDFSYIESNTS